MNFFRCQRHRCTPRYFALFHIFNDFFVRLALYDLPGRVQSVNCVINRSNRLAYRRTAIYSARNKVHNRDVSRAEANSLGLSYSVQSTKGTADLMSKIDFIFTSRCIVDRCGNVQYIYIFPFICK